jgi:hypothetical protein
LQNRQAERFAAGLQIRMELLLINDLLRHLCTMGKDRIGDINLTAGGSEFARSQGAFSYKAPICHARRMDSLAQPVRSILPCLEGDGFSTKVTFPASKVTLWPQSDRSGMGK